MGHLRGQSELSFTVIHIVSESLYFCFRLGFD